MDQTARYTRFPNLFSTVKSKQAQGTLQSQWPLLLPQELLILSWAALLQSYTGIAEPVFSFDGKAIQVDVLCGSWSEVQVEDALGQADHHTSITLNKPFRQSTIALEVQYDACSGRIALSSACCIPESFLSQVLSQLQHIVINRAASDDLFSADSAPLSSIVNPQRKVLRGPLLLHQLVQGASNSTIAIDFLTSQKQRVQLSYQDLDRLSDRLAKRLKAALAGHYDRDDSFTHTSVVPLLIPQSPELYVSQMAILKSGAAFCPLNLDVPTERLAFILKDVDARVVITTRACRNRFLKSEIGLDVVSLVIDEDDEDQATDTCPSALSQVQQHPDSLAYVMYTSGSTGLPKGVGVPHGAVTQALLAHEEHVPQYRRFLQFAAPTFDVSVFEVFFTFHRGATLVCCHREDMLNDLTGVMSELSVDAAELTPTVVGTLLRNWDAVPCLRLLLTIGEMLPRSVIEHFAQRPNSGRVLLPMYGPTEASIHCTIAPRLGIESRAVIIGRPLSTFSVFVITEEQSSEPHVLPMGHIGELAVAGQLAQGYINRSEQTRAAFVTLRGYGIVYRTGDRARLLPCRELEYIGRMASGQVKIRGQRAELGEIEQVICQVNSVRFAVASIIEGKLIVFCLLDDDTSISNLRQAMQEKCKAWLPPFMRPTDFIILTHELPQLPSGKIDRQSLESIYLGQTVRDKSGTDDSTSDLEKLVSQVIRNELGMDIGRYEDLWSRGLDSLRSIRVASELRSKGKEVAVTDILSADTIATLSEALQQRQASHSTLVAPINSQANSFEALKDILRSELRAAEFSNIENVVPCSKLQLAMLTESVLSKHVNFNWLKIEFAKSVSIADFVQAFCRLAELNGILRSGFIQSSQQKSCFARIIWKNFDPTEQIRFEEPDSAGPGETHDLTLSRPLRLTFVASKTNTTVWVCIHHALYDGWSWDLIMADLNLLISGAAPPERPHFQQFVQYEEAFLSSKRAAAAQEYWADHLRDVAPTPLPILTNAKCKADTRTFRRSSKMDLSLLETTSQKLRISRHSIPSAAFATLLNLYCGTSEVVFGSVSSGRTLSMLGIENLLGPCISTLPVRINFDRLRTVGDLLSHTHRLHHNFLHFGQLPLLDIKKLAGITASQALFDTLFVWQESLGSKENTKSALSVTDGRDSLRCALILEIDPQRHQAQVKATYDASVLCPEQIELLVSQFETIVAYYAQSPNEPWKKVFDHIRPQDLSIANSKFSSVDSAIEISSIIDRISQDDPMRIAIEFVDDFNPINGALKVSKVSYRDLSQKAGLVAQFLSFKGISVDELVCLFMHKSIQLYISILGVLKAGAAYIVIDPQAPPERTRRILDSARCRHCLTQSNFEYHEAMGKVGSVLFFDRIAEYAQPKLMLPTVDGTNLAYAVFTSGSTGIPKGVLITRKNILSNIDVLSRRYPSVADGALLQACSPAFDVSVFEILYTWHTGMRLCAASNDVLFRGIERFIELLKVTHLSLTPSVAALISRNKIPNVEMLVTAGEAVTSKVFGDWSGRGLYQGYGPSETTNICSVHWDVSPFDHINNIGQPLPNTSMFISSSQAFQPLPKGACGEIWIGGDQVGRGYLNDANLTAEKFIDHQEYGRLYRSGDIGRMLPNGSTLFHGRRDDQVKLRGHRIELPEIEHALRHKSAVTDAVCLLIEGSEQTPSRLVAWWSLAPSSKVDPTSYSASIFAKLQLELPAYMVPDYLIHVDVLPLTSQGKSDRKALKQFFLKTDPTSLKPSSRPEDPIGDSELIHPDEIKVGEAITDVTGMPLSVIGRNTSFFALGLDSINCISLSRRLLTLGFGQVDVSLILRHASIAKLLGALPATAEMDKGSESNLHHIFDKNWQQNVRLKYARKGFQVQKILPCTPLQQAMLSQAEGSNHGAYENQLTFSVLGDLQQLEAAWSTCIAAHEILRTGFILTNSSQFPFAQVVLADFAFLWDNKNHSGQVETGWEHIMMPPYSFTATRRCGILPPRLILKIHHALYDAQAVSLLLGDVERAYGSSPIEAFPIEPYLEFMIGLDEDHADGFWRAHLSEYRPKLVSQASVEWKSAANSEKLLCHSPSKVPLQALLESSKQTSVTILSLLQLTWARLLANYANDPDVCFGNVYSGRNLPIRNVERIIGPCFNTLPIRITLGKRDTNQQVARRLQDHSLAALCFQPFSLRRIQKNQRVSRLFDTLLLLQAEPVELDPSIWILEEDFGDVKIPLTLEVVPKSSSNQLDLIVHGERSLLTTDGAEAILTDFDILLEHVIQYPDALATDDFILRQEKPLLFSHPLAMASTVAAAHSPKETINEDWSSLERYICDVVCKVSPRNISQPTRDTTIFHLGVDSINAIQIAAELKKEGYRLTSGDILEAATVPKIALLCEKNALNGLDDSVSFNFDDFNKKHVGEVCHRHSIAHQAVEEIRPCTPFQLGILADFIRSQGDYYLNTVHYELDNDIDFRLLKTAWEVVSSRHDMLRTGFVEIDDSQCPFAMILYFQGMCALPWSEDDTPQVHDHAEYGQSLLGSLHRPPWRLSINKQGAHITMHLSMLHALFDARTLELLLEEVTEIYRGEKLPEVIPIKPCLSRLLHESSIQPADNVSISGDLSSSPSAKFPNLHSHNTADPDFYTVEYDCSRSLSQLQASCRKAGVTLQVAGQCAWARLLSAFTGESINTFGVVLTGHTIEKGEEAVVFPCINTVPVSLKVEGITNRTLLVEAAKRNAILMKNPFSAYPGWSKSQRALFDTLFVFQHRQPARTSSLWKVLAEEARAGYTVSVELLTTCVEKLHFRLSFRQQTIPIEQCKLLAKQFNALLLNTLDRLDDDASKFTNVDSHLTSIAPAKDPLIETEVGYLHQFVEISSRKSPKKNAFEFAVDIIGEKAVNTSWTYLQLDGEGNKIAHILQQSGASPGDFIGICFDKCPEASFTILGILKAGCAYVALDPHAPEGRKKFILKDSGCRILCTTQDKVALLALVDNLQILGVDELLKEKDSRCDTVALSRRLVADDVCYCLYTSGTTGTPKGCLITHGNAVQFVLAFQRLFAGHWDADSRFLQFASFHFDVSVMEQYWSWSIGICVTSAPRDLLFQDLPAAIRALQITHIDLTPSLARLLTPEECPSLCRGAFITGGEQLRQDVIDAWGDEGVIYNGYGPSEVTIGCTMNPRVHKSAKPSNIGPAYDNVGAYVLEPRSKHPVLRGAIGELCVSGPLVGKGYLNREELTAQKFEFLDHLQTQVYHTGDLVRLLHDGTFCFIGRADDQVKLRGQRLEIGEINHIIRQPSKMVKEVATMVLKHGEESKDLLVTFIASSESRATAEHTAIDSHPGFSSLVHRIRRACNDALPAYMVPTYIIPVTAMPLSANNKIDNKSLKALFEATCAVQLQELSAAQACLRNIDPGVIKKVVGVVSQVIGLPENTVLASSRLFELGLDSISAISLSRMLKRAGFDAANPSMIMRNSVVADLAIALTEAAPLADLNATATQAAKQDIAAFEKTHLSVIEEVLGRNHQEIERIAPCTPLQEGMIARSLNSDDATYFSSFAFALDTSLDLPRLQTAWMHVERENEILRTRFVPTGDGYAQVVLKHPASHSFRFQQLGVDQEDGRKNVLKHDFVHWFERSKGLENELWALSIYRTPEQILMTLRIFHGLYDGISLALILEEVACNYTARPNLSPKPSYHDILPFGPLLSPPGAQDFWAENLRMVRSLSLPLQRHRTEPIVVSSKIAPSESVKKLQLQLDVTEASIFHACWSMSLEKKFGILPIVGVVVSGRALDIDGIENVVGPLFNTIPCQIDADTCSTVADLVQACHSFNVEAMPYQHTPLSKISKWLGHKSTEPLFDSLFVFQKETARFTKSRKLWTLIDTASQPDYPLALEVEQGISSSFSCTIVAQGRHFRREEIQQLLDTFEKVLIDVLKDPHQPLAFSEEVPAQPLSARDTESRSAGIVNSKQVANGIVASKTEFQWDATSNLMRSEIAKLSALDIYDVSPYTSIFELGLDSIDAIKLSARFKAAKVSISVSSILQAGSIAEMVKSSAATEISNGSRSYPSIDQVKEDLRRSLKDQGVPVHDYEKVLPVTPLQESMLANYQQYYSQDVLRMSEEVDVEKLKSAWRTVVSAHDILRTSFVEVDDPESAGTYAQLVSRDIKFDCFSMTLDCEAKLQKLLSRQRAEVGHRGINQVALHLTFVSIGTTMFLIVGLPHAVYDGWSVNLLHQDVARCYNGLKWARPSYEPVLGYILGASQQESCSFWRNKLNGLRPRLFSPRRDEQPAHSTTNRHEVSSEVFGTQVSEFCRAAGVTIQSLALTCWALVLARYLKNRDVCFGVVLAGRDIENANEMMFPTMNTVPFRIVLQGNKLEMVKEVHKLRVAISEHQQFPLRKAKSLVENLSGQLFDTLFIYQKRPSPSEQLKPLYRSVDCLSDPEYPINVEMELLQDAIVWRTACRNDVLDAQGTQALLRDVDEVLKSIIQQPSEPALASSADEISACGLPASGNRIDEHSLCPAPAKVAKGKHHLEQSGLTPDEEVISQVLADVAKVERETISQSTNIFHLGLDSISAIKVSSALKKRSISLPVSKMLTALTVQRMAEVAKPLAASNGTKLKDQGKSTISWIDQDHVRDRLKQAGIREEKVEDVFPCSSGQEFFLRMCRASGGRLFYSNFHFRLEGPSISRETVNAGWQRLVQAVPVLRTTFLYPSEHHTLALQIVLRDALIPIVWTNDRAQNKEDMNSESSYPVQPPVMLLATETPTTMLLKLTIHHALYDGVSLPRMMSAFKSFCTNASSPTHLETAFHDYLSYLQHHKANDQQKTFWTSYLDGSPSLPACDTCSFKAERVRLFRPALVDNLSLIETKLRENGISFQALFFAAYALVHSKWVSRSACTSKGIAELLVGIYLANRSHDHKGLSELLAPTVNIVPLKIPVRYGSSLLESASAVQDDLGKIGSIEQCTVSLTEIHQWTSVKFDCFVNFLKLPDIDTTSDSIDSGVRIEEIEFTDWLPNDVKEHKVPNSFADAMPIQGDGIYLPSIDIEAAIRNGALDVGVFAPASLLDRPGAENLLEELRALLKSYEH